MHLDTHSRFTGTVLTTDVALDVFVTHAWQFLVIPSRFGPQINTRLSVRGVTNVSRVVVTFVEVIPG